MKTSWILAAALVPFFPGAILAQVPDGWFVVSGFKTPTSPALGGLFFVHPRNPGPPIVVTGLGAQVTGAGTTGVFQGAGSVLYRDDGALIVGEHAPSGTLDLHVVTLAGSTVALDTPIFLGNVAPGTVASTDQMAFLPNGNVLVSNRGFALTFGSPLYGTYLGIVDLSTGSVTPIPMSLPAGTPNAVAVDAAGTTAYLGTFIYNNPTYTSYVWSVPIPAGGAPAPCATLPGPGPVTGLAVDRFGKLLAASSFATSTTSLVEIDPASGCQVMTVSLGWSTLNGIAVERVTGNYALLYDPGAPSQVIWSTPAGTAVSLSGGPAGGWNPGGLAINPDPETYGLPSAGTNAYTWDLDPNPGGLPEVGNLAFSLRISGSPASMPGFWVASLGKLDPPVPILGVQANVNLTQIVLLGGLSGANPETIRLPIPPVPSLVGGKVFFQTAHVDPSGLAGLAASSGVEVTVL